MTIIFFCLLLYCTATNSAPPRSMFHPPIHERAPYNAFTNDATIMENQLCSNSTVLMIIAADHDELYGPEEGNRLDNTRTAGYGGSDVPITSKEAGRA